MITRTTGPTILDLALKTAPTETPVTLAEAKVYLRVDSNAEDALITGLVETATQWAQDYARSKFVDQEWTVTFDGFPTGSERRVRIPFPPLQSVDAVQYVDTEGNPQTFTGAEVVSGVFGYAELQPDQEWPQTHPENRSVEWTVSVGYGDASAVPAAVKQGILVAVATMYEHRIDQMTGTIVSAVQEKSSKALLMGSRRRFGF
jgi:uncharacterized phiE125 gp8 family phage protein